MYTTCRLIRILQNTILETLARLANTVDHTAEERLGERSPPATAVATKTHAVQERVRIISKEFVAPWPCSTRQVIDGIGGASRDRTDDLIVANDGVIG